MTKIGFGGSCHWCTEAIFLSIKGVITVDQGWIAPEGKGDSFSEAVIVTFNPEIITLKLLIEVHLHTHSCTATHSMREKYRSAIYTFEDEHSTEIKQIIQQLQKDFEAPIITAVLPFGAFKINSDNYLNYYFKDPAKPFCENIVNPKLKELISRYSALVNHEKLAHLNYRNNR